MKIFEKEPINWRDLQIKVAKIFSDMNYSVEIEKDIETARGIVNVDVFAKSNSFPNEVIIAECKNWNTAVPKTIVHSFRTVVADYVANTGYLISKKGFQNGAFNSASNSNIYLLSFDQFQEEYKLKYLNVIVHKLQKVGYPLRRYSDWQESAFDAEIGKLSKAQKALHVELCNKYDNISLRSVHISNYKNAITGELDDEYVDFTILDVGKKLTNVKISCYSDYFDYLILLFEQGVYEFDELFGKQLRK